MIYVFEDPVEFLERRAASLNEGQYRLILLFLASQFDEEFLKEVEGLSQDIDVMTGPHVMVLLFAPPPRSKIAELQERYGAFRSLGRIQSWSEWDNFLQTMTEATYRLASCFGINYRSLPALVFLDPQHPNAEVCVWPLDENDGSRSWYVNLRSMIGQWYQDNKATVDEVERLNTLVTTQWAGVPSNYPGLPILQHFVETSIVPKLVREATESNLTGKVLKQISLLSGHPRHTDTISTALSKSPYPLTVSGSVWNAANFNAKFFSLIHQEARRQRADALNRLDFAAKYIQNMKKHYHTERLIRRVDVGALELDMGGGWKFKLNPLDMIRSAFGIKSS